MWYHGFTDRWTEAFDAIFAEPFFGAALIFFIPIILDTVLYESIATKNVVTE